MSQILPGELSTWPLGDVRPIFSGCPEDPEILVPAWMEGDIPREQGNWEEVALRDPRHIKKRGLMNMRYKISENDWLFLEPFRFSQDKYYFMI